MGLLTLPAGVSCGNGAPSPGPPGWEVAHFRFLTTHARAWHHQGQALAPVSGSPLIPLSWGRRGGSSCFTGGGGAAPGPLAPPQGVSTVLLISRWAWLGFRGSLKNPCPQSHLSISVCRSDVPERGGCERRRAPYPLPGHAPHARPYQPLHGQLPGHRGRLRRGPLPGSQPR